MSTKTKKSELEAAEEKSGLENRTAMAEAETEAAAAAEDSAGEDRAAEQAREERMKEFFAKLPDPCVYCGPSVRGVARQYTVYNGGIPEAVKGFVLEHPAARGLLVSMERFPQIRVRLETQGTAEAILFNKDREELKA